MKNFIKFIGIGGISTLLQFLILIFFVELRLLPKIIASAASYFLSSVFNYLANYYFTFKSSADHQNTLPKFALVVAIGLSVNTLLFSIFSFFISYYLIAQCLATGITVILNF